jgi:hypothetical protein
MLFELSFIGIFLAVLIIIFLIALFFWGIKVAIAYAINAVIGFFALYAMKAFVWPDLIINFWSVAIVAVGGLLGFILVIVFHLVGLWF